MAAKKLSGGTASDRIVLAVALVDAEDDHDGASFMLAEQRRSARKLAADGYLKIVSENKSEVVAKLTAKGRKLIEQRARSEERPARKVNERQNLVDAVRRTKIAYQEASNEFQSAKREGPQDRISRAYRALGMTSVERENAEQVLAEYEAKHR